MTSFNTSARPATAARAALTTRAALTAALAAAALTACSSESTTTATPAGSADGFPVELSNCGFDVTLDAAPERIVTIKSTSTELVLELGLADRLVGHAFPDGAVPAEHAEAIADVELISEKAPSQEVVLEREPDLIFAGWESNLAADTAGERDVLAKLGVASYVSPAACQSADVVKKMTFDHLFDQFLEAGQVLGAEEAAAALVEAQQKELAATHQIAPGTTALWWSSGDETPFVGGRGGAPQMVMEEAGLENVVEVDDAWSSLSWEAIVESDPDVLVLVDAEWNTAESKMEKLAANPATSAMTAVKEERYLVVPFPAAEAGVRSVSAVGDLVDQAREHGFTTAPR